MEKENIMAFITECTGRVVEQAQEMFGDVPEKGTFDGMLAWERAPEGMFRHRLAFILHLYPSPLPGQDQVRAIDAEVYNLVTKYKATRMLFCGKKSEMLRYLRSSKIVDDSLSAFSSLKDTALSI